MLVSFTFLVCTALQKVQHHIQEVVGTWQALDHLLQSERNQTSHADQALKCKTN